MAEAVRTAVVPPPAQDAALAAALFALAFGPGRSEGVPGAALQAALVLPLVWRRRAPLAVFWVICAVALVQWFLGLQLPADAALLVALATVAARSPWRPALVAGAVLEAGALMSAARWAPEGRFAAAAAVLTTAIAVSALLGANVRIRRTAHLERLAHLERDREQRQRLAVSAERSSIARELHDSVTHNLSVMIALADAVRYARPDDAPAVTGRIAETGRQALTDMRRSLGLLEDDPAEPGADGAPDGGPPEDPDDRRRPLPGLAQLEPLCDRMRAVGMPTRLRLDPGTARLPAAAQLAAYRIVQESLTNTLKHAPAGTRAEVRVSGRRETVTVEVTDDGPAAPAGRPPAAGRGISGMRQRAAAYGGTLDAGPLPGGGWRVRARLVPGGAG
ncbi:histidine kinase [Streptomyces sp. NPDC089919]|uniref:sensor histidine kinase n=1 Tax=Streptomyces sp. NPDC089919 TaxID=3155188 RepID=UPI0034185DFD